METHEKAIALEIFPSEVWLLILDKVGACEDLKSCYNSDPLFRNLLAPKRTLILFDEVLEVLWKNSGFRNILFTSELEESDEDDDVSDNEDDVSLFHPCLLELRLVCRSWKFAMDTVLSSYDFYLCHLNDRIDFNPFFFERVEEISGFMKLTQPHSRDDNPFCNRLIHLEEFNHFAQWGRASSFWNGVSSRLLPKFGHHVRYCHIIKREGIETLYWILRQILPQIPALEALHLEAASYQCYSRILEEIEATPLPPMTTLFRLSLNNVPLEVCNEILRAASNSKLKVLHVSFRRVGDAADFTEALSDTLSPSLMEQMEELKLSPICQRSTLTKLPTIWPALTELDLTIRGIVPKAEGPPEEDEFDFERQNREDGITFESLFKTLNGIAKGSKFKTLTLTLEAYDSDLQFGEIGRFKMPLLKKLRIYADSIGLTSLDFLSDLTALEDFFVSAEDFKNDPVEEKDGAQEKIQFAGFSSRMRESNIWEIMPKLGFFGLSCKDGFYLYDRDGHDFIETRDDDVG